MTVMFKLMPCLLAGPPYRPTLSLRREVHDHVGNDFFATPLIPFTWHDFAVQVDWDNLTLGVFYSSNNF